MTRRLAIRDVEEVERAEGGFPAALLRALAAVAGKDGDMSTSEYACLVEAANAMAEGSPDPSLPTAVAMRALSEPEGIDRALKALRDAAKDMDREARRSALDTALPLLRLQGDEAGELFGMFAKALDVRCGPEDAGIAPPVRPRGMLDKAASSIGRLLGRREDERLAGMLAVAQAHGHAALAKAIGDGIASGRTDVAELRGMCEELSARILRDVEELARQREALSQRREMVELLHQATSANVRQVEQRLAAVIRRVEFQKRAFREDVRVFVEDASNEVELVMRERMRTDDWLDKDVWESFAKTQHGRAVQLRHGELKRRYEEQIELLKEELMQFREELVSTRSAFMASVDHKKFGRLVPPPSFGARFFGAADTVANRTLVATGLAAAGGAAAVAAGAIGVAALAPIAAPLGAVVFGPMAVAGLYKWMSDPERRKEKEMRAKRKAVEAGIEAMMAETLSAHDMVLDGIVDEFFAASERCLTPLVHVARRTLDVAALQDRWMERSARHTAESVRLLSGWVDG